MSHKVWIRPVGGHGPNIYYTDEDVVEEHSDTQECTVHGSVCMAAI